MKNDKYFAHYVNAFNNDKITELMMQYGLAGYGCFFAILEILCANNGFFRASYKVLAFKLHCEEELVRAVVEDFDLFQLNEDGAIYSKRLLEDMQTYFEDKNKSLSQKRAAAGKKGGKNGKQNGKQNEANDILLEANSKQNEANDILLAKNSKQNVSKTQANDILLEANGKQNEANDILLAKNSKQNVSKMQANEAKCDLLTFASKNDNFASENDDANEGGTIGGEQNKTEQNKTNLSLSAHVRARETDTQTETEKERFEILGLFFKNGSPDPLEEYEKFYNYYAALGWRNSKGANIVNRYSAAKLWKIDQPLLYDKEFRTLWHRAFKDSHHLRPLIWDCYGGLRVVLDAETNANQLQIIITTNTVCVDEVMPYDKTVEYLEKHCRAELSKLCNCLKCQSITYRWRS